MKTAGPRRRIKSPQQLRRVIARLSPASPITDRFSAKWRRLGSRGGFQKERKTVWYRTQHEHWLGWLGEYAGPGAYGRKDHDRSAEFAYNHIVNPQMLVYLAEAAGIRRGLVLKAVRAALANWATMTAMSSAIRQTIPWAVVEGALVARWVGMRNS